MTLAALSYFLVAVGISALVTVIGLRSGAGVPTAFRALFEAVESRRTYMGLPVIIATARSRPWVLVIVAFAIAPTVAALTVPSLGGPIDIDTVLGSLSPIRSDAGAGALSGVAVYVVIGASLLTGCVWYLRVTRSCVAAGDIAEPALLRGRGRGDVAARLAVGPLVDEGGTLEELGWRGYLLPLLLLELDRGPATIAVAVLWWAWHLPREAAAWRKQPFLTWARAQGIFVMTCIGLSVVCTEAVMRTGGSVWPAVLIHGGTNVWSKALAAGPNHRFETDVRTVIVMTLAAMISFTWLL